MEDDKGHKYTIVTTWEHLVSRYTGLTISQVDELNCVDYLVLRRDAFIYRMSQTEKGVEYLENAYRLEQTKPDRESLREQFGEEG